MNRRVDNEWMARWMERLTHLPIQQPPPSPLVFFFAKWIPILFKSLAAGEETGAPGSASCLVQGHHDDMFSLARGLFRNIHVMQFWPRRCKGKSTEDPPGKFSSLKEHSSLSGLWTLMSEDETLRGAASMRRSCSHEMIRRRRAKAWHSEYHRAKTETQPGSSELLTEAWINPWVCGGRWGWWMDELRETEGQI